MSVIVQGPAIDADDAAWAAAGRATVSDATKLVSSDDLGTAAYEDATAFEAALGNPGTNGYLLSSTTLGARTWIAPAAGGGGDFKADGSVPMIGGLTFGQPSATDFTLMTIDPADADALPFYWKLWTSAQTGRDNVGWNLGYNQAAIGGAQTATDATFYLQMETHYNPTGTDPLFEYHLNAYTANGLSSTRPFQINVYKDDLYTEMSYFFDKFNWITRNGSVQLMTVISGVTAASSQWIMYMPPVIRVDGQAALMVKNTANANRILMGENGTGDGGYLKMSGTAPTLEGDTGKYLMIQNFAGISFPGSLGLMYGSGVWDGAPNISLAAGKKYKIDSVQVVGPRVIDARCDDAINSGDATTDGVIDALRDAMIAHGLIAAA